jgi:3-dehydroquinate synthase
VWRLHGRRLKPLAGRSKPVLVADGERAKTMRTVERIHDALVKAKADRSAVVIALGGGVIGDVVGFAAATYLRGVRIVHLPTTVVAQVDSAIGGKTGVNHPLGKNLIGAFHAPSLVVADPIVLETLPRREFRAGLYEVIKYGVISDPTLLDRIRDSMTAIFAREGAAVAPLVAASCRIKAQVVSADERESGLRRILNFGHTIGHALESVTKYKQFRHGEAIGYGMLAALAIGVARGVTPKSLYEEVESLITQLGPLPSVADISTKDVIAAIGRDKKVVNGTLHFIAAAERGKTVELTDVTEKEIKAALKKIGLRA